ncbi:MAG TPA: hypothetical protein VFW45_18600 [Candidatus Polarisedimenticolia bacterium]|nr:hypothetical protein [Candidatus Polarisedimenticolia bacterium]
MRIPTGTQAPAPCGVVTSAVVQDVSEQQRTSTPKLSPSTSLLSLIDATVDQSWMTVVGPLMREKWNWGTPSAQP